MKILVFANADGNLDLVAEMLMDHTECSMAVSLGDMCLASESTPLEKFLREKFRHQASQAIRYNREGNFFVKPVYTLFGSLDDPFIPPDEFAIGNLFPIWTSTMNLMAYNETRNRSRNVKAGFISGYFNLRSFKMRNAKRALMSRERKSLALSLSDFRQFYGSNLDVLFTYESPIGFPKEGIGCPLIMSTIRESNASLTIYGHHRAYAAREIEHDDKATQVIGLGTLEDMYLVLDIFENTVKVFETKTNRVIDELSYGEKVENRTASHMD